MSGDTGFVSVITEVKSSGAVSVPIEWKANYPRTYKIWGKVKLQDEPWLEVKSGDAANYNFFKVSVEMK